MLVSVVEGKEKISFSGIPETQVADGCRVVLRVPTERATTLKAVPDANESGLADCRVVEPR